MSTTRTPADGRTGGRGRCGVRLRVGGDDGVGDQRPDRGRVIGDLIVGSRAGHQGVVADDLGARSLGAGHDRRSTGGIDRGEHQDLGARRERFLGLLRLEGRVAAGIPGVEDGRGADLGQLGREGGPVNAVPSQVGGVRQQQGDRDRSELVMPMEPVSSEAAGDAGAGATDAGCRGGRRGRAWRCRGMVTAPTPRRTRR